jgi:hypothetical protein
MTSQDALVSERPDDVRIALVVASSVSGASDTRREYAVSCVRLGDQVVLRCLSMLCVLL